MSERNDNDMNELLQAYEADKERRNVREDELQAAKDYLGVLLQEIESKNRELEEKKAEAGKLADALKKSEDEKQAEVKANEEAKESNRYKSIWIGIAIIEFLVVIALIISLFVVYDSLKNDNDGKSNDPNGTVQQDPDSQNVTATPAPVTGKNIEDLSAVVSQISSKLEDGFDCSIETIDGLEYLVFSSYGFKLGYKNEYYLNDTAHKKAIFFEKGDKRIIEPFEYDFEINPETLCPKWCNMNGTKMVVLTDYTGYGRIPDTFRIIDINDLTEYYGDNQKAKETLSNKILSLMKNVGFSDLPSGLAELPILFEFETSKASYKYGLTDSGYSEIGYNNESGTNNKDLVDISSEFRLEIGEEGISWTTVVKLGRKYYLGELKGDLLLGQGSVVVGNVKFGAYVNPNVEDPDMLGIIVPAESIPERYITINGYNSERYYVAINDKIPECTYDWSRLDTTDSNNWTYLDENGAKASIRGIDVSKYQGVIDWKKVAAAGVEFAIIRMGYRGMNEGTLEVDPYFEANMKGASEAGIKTGVYFFSQAITKEEAEEEAKFVLDAIDKYNVTYPVIFDTERVTTYNARANGLSYEQRTDMCIAFCDKVAAAGYTPMIYANTKYMIMGINLERLAKYDRWFAAYSSNITFPYSFQMFQYSESGSIPGIKGNVDLNISFVDYSKADDSNE